jgi:aminoglycoside phosphotransferase (APT) family kinase protein
MSNAAQQKPRHELDDGALGQYLQPYLPNLKLPIVSTKIGYGQSNPTYFIDDTNDVRYILRKKPSGTIISPVAHQVDREYKVLKALGTVCVWILQSLAPLSTYVYHPPVKRYICLS